MVSPRLTYPNVMSTAAVFVALGGTSYAVARNSIATAEPRNGSLTAIDLAESARGVRGPRGVPGPAGSPGLSYRPD